MEKEIAAALKKVEKFEGDAKQMFLSRLGQLEEDLKTDDLSGIPYSIALLVKIIEQSDFSHAGVCSRLRLTEGKTNNDLNDLNDVGIQPTFKSFNTNHTETSVENEFERDFRKLPIAGQELVTRWNEILSLPRIETLRSRVTVIRRAMSSAYFNTNWSEALTRLARSKFCTGGGSRRWRATIDWFLDPKNIQALMSGQFDEKTKPSSTTRTYESEEI